MEVYSSEQPLYKVPSVHVLEYGKLEIIHFQVSKRKFPKNVEQASIPY